MIVSMAITLTNTQKTIRRERTAVENLNMLGTIFGIQRLSPGDSPAQATWATIFFRVLLDQVIR
jgi:hypothetical protein